VHVCIVASNVNFLPKCDGCTSDVTGQSMAIHVGETTIAFPFKREQAQQLSSSVRTLLETFAEKQKAERPKRWNMMEFKQKGQWLSCGQ
jgi:hypothetical protein